MSVFLKPLKYKLNFYKIVKKSKLEKQIPKLPKKIIFCKLCVMSNQRPRMVFDTNGICSSCKWNKEKEKTIDWSKRKKELIQMVWTMAITATKIVMVYAKKSISMIFINQEKGTNLKVPA